MEAEDDADTLSLLVGELVAAGLLLDNAAALEALALLLGAAALAEALLLGAEVCEAEALALEDTAEV